MSEVPALEQAILGTTTNGVPFLALPPEGVREPKGLIILWHGADPPRTEAALAGALPLSDLAAWRVYLGLPLSGQRLPEGGPDELMRRGAEDAVTLLFHPIIIGAVAELSDAIDNLRMRLGIDPRLPLGIFGFSAGGSAALLAVARRELTFRAVVTFGAVVDVRAMVDYLSSLFGTSYEWTGERERLARQISAAHFARDLAESGADILLGIGSEDTNLVLEPMQQLESAIRKEGGSAQLRTIASVGHGFVDEPGHTAVPQGPQARAVEQLAAQWFRRHLA